VAGLAIITEACIDVKDRACVNVCPVQCIYEFDPQQNVLFSEEEAGSGVVETSHVPNSEAIAIFGDSILYVNLDECTSCTACYQPDVCPVGAIYSDEHVPDGPLLLPVVGRAATRTHRRRNQIDGRGSAPRQPLHQRRRPARRRQTR
jgi:Fe-S-cluster-containing hydrogenase component 2